MTEFITDCLHLFIRVFYLQKFIFFLETASLCLFGVKTILFNFVKIYSKGYSIFWVDLPKFSKVIIVVNFLAQTAFALLIKN